MAKLRELVQIEKEHGKLYGFSNMYRWTFYPGRLYREINCLRCLMQHFFEFGVLTSNVHMAWMRVVCGRAYEAVSEAGR